MGTASKPIMTTPQQVVVSNVLFTPVGGHITMDDLTAARTITPGALGIDVTDFDRVDKVKIQADTQNVRITYSAGSTPTSTGGFLIRTTDEVSTILITNGVMLKAIEAAGGAVLQVQFGV